MGGDQEIQSQDAVALLISDAIQDCYRQMPKYVALYVKLQEHEVKNPPTVIHIRENAAI
jgi:hypothetical protein